MPRKKNAPNGQDTLSSSFEGFPLPKSNYFKLPGIWIDITAEINNLSELKIVQYVLRHTWSFEEYGIKKRITIDEFINGRKRKDGSRMDKGTGLSEQSVRNGLKAAIEHGWIEELVDDRDKARIKKYYGLRMREQAEEDSSDEGPGSGVDELEDQVLSTGVQSFGAGVQTLDPDPLNLRPRTPIRTTSTNSSISTNLEKLEELTLHKTGEGTFSSKKQTEKSKRNSETANSDANHDVQNHTLRRPKRASKSSYPPKADSQDGAERFVLPPPPHWLVEDVTKLSYKFHDEEHIDDNIKQANNLFLYTGAETERFQDKWDEAERRTLDHDVQKRANGPAGEIGLRNKMPYHFACLRDLFGIKDIPAHRTRPNTRNQSKSLKQRVREDQEEEGESEKTYAAARARFEARAKSLRTPTT